MFRHLPEKLRTACVALLVSGLLLGVFGGMGVVLLNDGGPQPADGNSLRVIVVVVLIGASVISVATAFLLSAGVRFAVPLAWTVAAGLLLLFPLGTIVGAILMIGIGDRETREYLQHQQRRSSPGSSKNRKRRRPADSERSRSDRPQRSQRSRRPPGH